MKHKALMFVAVTVIVALGLAVVHQVLAGGSSAPAFPSGPPVTLDGAGASLSGVDGATATGGSFKMAPAGFPPSRLSGVDVSAMPGWDSDAGHIGVPGIDNGTVYALAVDDAGNVYAGGTFTNAGGIEDADYLARWSSVEGWSAVGSVITGPVHAIAVAPDGSLYIGGEFTKDFGSGYDMGYVVRRYGGSWYRLRGGVDGPVKALAVAPNGDVYAGGSFTQANVDEPTQLISVRGIARWNGSRWRDVGGGVMRPDTTPGQVNALAIDGKDVYAGGDFYYAGDSGDPMPYVARWDSAASQWESINSPLAHQVDALTTNGSELYVAARTGINGGFRVEQVDLADDSWTQLASSSQCDATTCDRVYALAASQSNIFVGGRFSTITGTVSANWIARWNSRNETWFAMGSGISDSGHQQQDDGVWAFALDGGDLYAGGDFQHANGQDAHRLAHWVPHVADLGVFQETAPPGVIDAGEQITYEVTVLHHGYQKAKNVVLEDVLPAEVTLEQADCGSGTLVPPATCELGKLKAGARETVRFVASLPPTLTKGMTLTNVANVVANQYDPALAAVFPANNTYTVTTQVSRRAVLRLEKEAPAAADVGDAVPYTLTVTNDGPSVATAVVLTDTLPDGVLLKSYPGGGACSSTNTRVVCQLGEMLPHDSETVVIEVTPYVVGTLTNEAQASAAEADAPAMTTADTDVSGTIGMHVLKTDGVGEVGLNEPLTYTLTVWATGTPLVEDVCITDTLPSAVTLRSVDPSQGTCSGASTVLCDVGDLTGGEFVTVTIGVTPTVEGTLVNTAQVGGSGVDPAFDTDDDTEVRDVADLQVTKSGPGAATAGQAFDYAINVVNDGPASTTDVTLTDDLPDGLYLNTLNASQGTCSWTGSRASAAVTCDLGAMANGAGAEVTLNVTPLLTGTLENSASASSPKADDVSDNDADTLETTVGSGTTGVRTVDGLTIEAYVFVDLPGGDTTAYGVVSLGDHFYLSGPNDAVTFGSGALTGDGTLTFKQGDLPVWEGDFSSSAAAGWELTLGSGASALPHLAGFILDSSSLSSVNLLTGQVTGNTTALRLEPPGCSAVVAADFTITPGPTFSGTLPDAFTIAAGAFDLAVPAGATLSNDGISASPVDLVLPAYFGAGRVEGATLTIRPNNLLLGGSAGVAFDVPDLRFDDQDTLVIKDAEGMLARFGDEYVIIMWNGDLHVTLPGNTPVIPLGEARLTASGEIDVERLDAFPLEVAGGTLTVEYAFLTNPELAVTEAVFQWPENLGGKYQNVSDVHVTASGTLSVDGNVDIALPDVLILGGETLRVNHPIANLIEGAKGYTFDVTDGEVLVTLLQQNDHTLDLAAGEVDLDGHFRGRMVQDALTLDVAGAELTISGLSSGWPLNDTTGLAIGPAVTSAGDVSTAANAAGQGEWQLPAPLGGGSLTFDALIVIDGDGLHLNDGNSVPFPNANLDGDGFPVLNNSVTLGEGDDLTYELNLAGAISVTIPGFSGFTDGDLTLDSLGNLSGSAEGLEMLLGGLELGVDQFLVEGGNLLTEGGTLSAPPGFGGDQVTLNGMGLLDADLGLVGWGMDDQGNVTSATVQLPSLSLNGYDCFALEGSYRRVDRLPIGNPDGVDDGYEITGHGLMRVPGFGTSMSTSPPKKPANSHSKGPACTGFEISFRLVIGTDGQTHMTVFPASTPSAGAGGGCLAAPMRVSTDEITARPAAMSQSSLRLIEVDSTLYCSIDIPELMLSVGNPRLNGGWDGDQDKIWVGGGISAWTMMQIFGHPLATGDLDMLLVVTPDWQTIDVTGTVKILDLWDYASATGHIGLDYGVPVDLMAELTINQMPWTPPYYPIPMVGTAGFHVWTDWSPSDPTDIEFEYFHFTGWAALDIEVPEGIVWDGCLGELCSTMPPFDIHLAGVSAEFGEFRTDSDSVWGFKAQLDLLDIYETGIYIDANGDWDFGDVDEYVLLDSQQMQRIHQAWLAAQEGHLTAAAAIEDYDLYTFATDTIVRTVPVATASDLSFMLSRSGPVPTMTLISPRGVEITPDTTLPNVQHHESYSPTVPYTQTTYLVGDAQPGDWQVMLHGNIGPDDDYVLGVIGADPSPTLTGVQAWSTGATSARATWRLASDEITTTLNIHATPGPITRTLTVTHTDGTTETVTQPVYVDGPVALDVDTPLNGARARTELDLSHLASGTYWIWVEANDGRNAPVRAYAPRPVQVTQGPPTSWSPTVVVTPTYLGLEIAWDPLQHPDVDGYTVYVSDGTLSAQQGAAHTTVITTPWDSTVIDTWLTPGRTYNLVIEAFDRDGGWRLRSSTATGVPLAAAFELTTTTPEVTVTGGGSTNLDIALVRTGDVTPTVGLRLGDLPDGIDAALTSSRWLTPTLLPGTPASLVISATDTLPGGVYTATIAGFGGGGLATLDVGVRVEEPHFTLAATPPTIALNKDGVQSLTISATGFNGESDPIHLDVLAPRGLRWALSDDVVDPNGDVTLEVTDTFLVGHGQYELHIVGRDGEHEVDLVVPLEIIEPGFDLISDPTRRWVLVGDQVVYPIQVSPRYGWTDPVTLTLDAAWLPPHSTGGFTTTLGGPLQTEVVVTPPERVQLMVDTAANTPEDLYLLPVDGESGAERGDLDLQLGVVTGGVDLTLDKMVDDRTPGTGWNVVYTVTVTNNGPEDATGVVVSDTLPAGLSYQADDGGGSYDSASGAWSVGGLGIGESKTLHITARVDAAEGALIVNTAVISASDQTELDGTNNQGQVALAVAGADLAVEKSVDNPTPREGEAVVYTVNVANQGHPSTVVIRDVLPDGVSYLSDDGAGAYDAAAGAWTVGSLGEGDAATLHITAQVDADTAGSTIVNTAAISTSSRVDPYPDDDMDSAAIAAQDPDAVIITVTPQGGGTLTYTDNQGLVTEIKVPPGAVSETVTLIFTPLPTPTHPSELFFAGHAFDLAVYHGADLLSGYAFQKPVVITIHYSDEDVEGTGEATVALHRWNGQGWEDAACGPYDRHPRDNWLSLPVCHLSQFALWGPSTPVGGSTLPVRLLALSWRALIIGLAGALAVITASAMSRRLPQREP